ncbi:hypothetical protein INT45_009473 [Circinella minor]|uniref:Ndc10 domain-containing protein n=1 Tax=Circinella minor TaxID=1195481 RepID=A0A8H7RPL7_9FUNG|nr:hypothetical protein INT45_009473 [Circinella minor]
MFFIAIREPFSKRKNHKESLQSLGALLDVIKKGGDWKDCLGRLETHYLSKLPSQFARGMAGFWDKPFRLLRNNVSPSLKLQKIVFPWIEDCYGPDNDPWKKFCEDEMYERDENDDDSDEGDFGDVEFVEQDGIQHQHSKNEHTASQMQKNYSLRRSCFLYLKRENAVVNSKRRHDENNLFLTPEFKEFQKQVIASLNNPSTDRLQEYEELVPHIVDLQVEVQLSSRLESVILGMEQQVQHMYLMAASMSIDGSDFAPASSSSFSPSSNAIINPPIPRALPPAPASPSQPVRISPSPHPQTFINNNNNNNNNTAHSPSLW